MEGQEHVCKVMCEHCPIEKDTNGACFDVNGIWTDDENGNKIYECSWKCVYYNMEEDICECMKMK